MQIITLTNIILVALGVIIIRIIFYWINRTKETTKEETEKNKPMETEEPSEEHLAFAEKVLEIISPTIESFGFKHNKTEIKKYYTNIVWRKGEQYIRVFGNTYPTDPSDYKIILGEGSSDDVFEYDWNSISIIGIAKSIEPTVNFKHHVFPFGDKIQPSMENASRELLKYGETFLKGNLELFHETRKKFNQERQPYKFLKNDGAGKYIVSDEPISAEKKKKYS